MKKALLFVHKWLGIALALLFLVWFASGLVLYFVPFPSLTPAARLAGVPVLALGDACCLTAQQAADRAGLEIAEARLGMHDGAPVWRLLRTAPDKRWSAVDARTGAALPALNDTRAIAVAEAFSGRRAVHAQALERDQWTVAQGFNPYRPLLRVELDGDDGLELYVSRSAAEVVGATRRSERAWNWVGAIPHWIYFTELRRWPERWHNVVVWLSLPGVVLAATGLALGIWQLFLNRSRWIPYRIAWMRWHHILGLAAGVVTLTWIFSGLMSMNPFSVFSSRGATADEQRRWSGPAAPATLPPAAALQAAGPLPVREIDTVRFNGQAWYRLRSADATLLVRADGSADARSAGGARTAALAALPDADVRTALARLRSDGNPGNDGNRGNDGNAVAVELTRLTAYDDLYYARGNDPAQRQSRPLPVWRARWADGVAAYADPASARIVLRTDDSNRWQRLLYNGLHSFDFAPLLARPWLRDGLVVLLSLLGAAMSITACVVAWRVFVPRKRRR